MTNNAFIIFIAFLYLHFVVVWLTVQKTKHDKRKKKKKRKDGEEEGEEAEGKSSKKKKHKKKSKREDEEEQDEEGGPSLVDIMADEDVTESAAPVQAAATEPAKKEGEYQCPIWCFYMYSRRLSSWRHLPFITVIHFEWSSDFSHNWQKLRYHVVFKHESVMILQLAWN